MVYFSSLILFISLITFACSRDLPSFIKPCKRNDPNLDRCLVKLIEGIRPNLAKGIPEMRIPPLDPFHVPMVVLDQGTGPVNFKAVFKNIVAHGARNYNLTGVNINFDVPTITIDVGFPVMRIVSNYTISGKVLVVTIKGNGRSEGNFTNISANVVLNGIFNVKNNRTFMNVRNRKINLNIGGLRLYFNNLFNGNKQLSDSTNAFINENWKDIIQEINPLIEDTVGEVMMQIIKGFLDLYSLEDLIPY